MKKVTKRGFFDERAVQTIIEGRKWSIADCHWQDCCEEVYADWDSVDKCELLDVLDNAEYVRFSNCEYGFRICADGHHPIFVPCYNIQNGYYNNTLTIALWDNVNKHGTTFNANTKDEDDY